ncbi:MAG TPA: SDR family NAD(P)-dependent oxidoreductase, partial [Lysobacter sp.]
MSKHESANTTQHKAASVRRPVSDQRAIQSRIDHKDAKKPPVKKCAEEKKKPVQAGARNQPEPPLPAQHLRKPGMESELALKPRYLAPEYRGSGKLDGMVALVTGGDSGIGRAVAVLFAREGADVAIAYLSEHEDAQQTRRQVEKEGRRCIVISGDVKDTRFCEQAVTQAVRAFGKLDILVNNAAFQEHSHSL